MIPEATSLLELLHVANAGQPMLWTSVFSFAVAVMVLGLFDIPLPRGDIVGVGGTLDAVALAVLGPVAAFVSSGVGIVGAAVALRTGRALGDVWPAAAARFAGLLVASSVYVVAPSSVIASQWLLAGSSVLLYLLTELVIAQLVTAKRTHRSLRRLIRGNLHRLTPVLLAQLSTAMLAIVVYEDMREWSLLLVVALLLLIRQSYSLFLEIGETYRTTVEVLVQAAEGYGSERHGHAERTAQIAREIAMGCGLTPRQVERVSYAALLHDIDALSSGERSPSQHPCSSDVLSDIAFFQDVVGIMRVCDGLTPERPVSPEDRLLAFIVALSSDIDAARFPEAHEDEAPGAVLRMASLVPAALKARAVSVAIHLGFSIPAVA